MDNKQMDQGSVKIACKNESINVDFIYEENEIEQQNTLNSIPLLSINNSLDYKACKNSNVNEIPCLYHKKMFIQFVNINPNNTRKIQCYQCVFELQSQYQDLISLNEIFKSDHISFIHKWGTFSFPQFQIYAKENKGNEQYQINLRTLKDLTQKLNTLITTWQNKLRPLLNGFTIKPKNTNIYSGKLELLSKIQKKNSFNNQTFKEFDQFMNQSLEQGIIFEKEIKNNAFLFLSEIFNQFHFAQILKDQLKLFIENGKTNLRDFQKVKMDLQKIKDILMKTLIEDNSVKIKFYNNCFINQLNEFKVFQIDCKIHYYQKYEILIHFEKNEKDQLYILLEPFSLKQAGKSNNRVFVPIFNTDEKLNLLRVIKGKAITQCSNFEREKILLQICLSENTYILKFGDNVNEINFKWSKEPYQVVFEMFDIQSLIIKYFRAVNTFSQ